MGVGVKGEVGCIKGGGGGGCCLGSKGWVGVSEEGV